MLSKRESIFDTPSYKAIIDATSTINKGEDSKRLINIDKTKSLDKIILSLQASTQQASSRVESPKNKRLTQGKLKVPEKRLNTLNNFNEVIMRHHRVKTLQSLPTMSARIQETTGPKSLCITHQKTDEEHAQDYSNLIRNIEFLEQRQMEKRHKSWELKKLIEKRNKEIDAKLYKD